jgi:hypothetical protein
MSDLYLFAATEDDMNAVLLEQGIVTAQTVETQVGETEHGDAILQDVTVLVPTQDFSVDQIGPITIWDYSVEPPVETTYSDWHTNLRGSFTEEQLAALEAMRVYPPLPYRVWA